jgi:hypothetical protein
MNRHVDAPIDPAVRHGTVQPMCRVEAREGAAHIGGELVARPVGIDQKLRRIEIEPGGGNRRQPEPRRIGVIAAQVLDRGTKTEGADLDAEGIEGFRVRDGPPQRRRGGDGRDLGLGARGRRAGPELAQSTGKRRHRRLQQPR